MNSVPGSGPGTESSKVVVFQGKKTIPLSSGGARPKLASYSNSSYPKPQSNHFSAPMGVFVWIYWTGHVSGGIISPVRARNTVRFGKSVREMCSVGFWVRGTRILGQFWCYNLELSSGSNFPHNLGGRSKFGVPGHIYLEIK